MANSVTALMKKNRYFKIWFDLCLFKTIQSHWFLKEDGLKVSFIKMYLAQKPQVKNLKTQ